MIETTTKSTVVVLLCLVGMGQASGDDLLQATLSGAASATDYYRVTCGAGTDHLNFKASRTVPSAAAQQQNLRVAKGGFDSAQADAIAPGQTGEASVAGGKGPYRVTIDTRGSAKAGKQAYSAAFRCRGAAGQTVKTSVTSRSGTVKGQAKNLAVVCGKGADRLVTQLSNTTKGVQILIAQAVKQAGYVATSVPDGTAGDVQGGEGDYLLTVAHTAANGGVDFQYQLQGSCLDVSGASVGTPAVVTLQSAAP